MAIERSRKIALYPKQDFKTKVIKPGMQSVKLTEEHIAQLHMLKVGDRITTFPNGFKDENPSSPHEYILLPDPARATTSNDF